MDCPDGTTIGEGIAVAGVALAMAFAFWALMKYGL